MTPDPTAIPPARPSHEALSPDFSSPAEVDVRDLITEPCVLIALDFDGVLAPLQDNPETSRIVPASSRAITALSALPGTRVALVSGRDIATLRRLAEPPEEVWIVGSHGAEVALGNASDVTSPSGSASAPQLSAAELEMLAAIDEHIDSFEHTLPAGGTADGTETAASETAASGTAASGTAASGTAPSGTEFRVERKPYSRTVHTRGFADDFAAALHAHVVAVQAEFPDIRVIEGHDITELAVKTATKGDGLRALIAAASPTAVLYLGDDVTDEDAFAELEDSIAGVGVKVGSAPTRASWRIADPAAVAELLTRIVVERRAALS